MSTTSATSQAARPRGKSRAVASLAATSWSYVVKNIAGFGYRMSLRPTHIISSYSQSLITILTFLEKQRNLSAQETNAYLPEDCIDFFKLVLLEVYNYRFKILSINKHNYLKYLPLLSKEKTILKTTTFAYVIDALDRSISGICLCINRTRPTSYNCILTLAAPSSTHCPRIQI